LHCEESACRAEHLAAHQRRPRAKDCLKHTTTHAGTRQHSKRDLADILLVSVRLTDHLGALIIISTARSSPAGPDSCTRLRPSQGRHSELYARQKRGSRLRGPRIDKTIPSHFTRKRRTRLGRWRPRTMAESCPAVQRGAVGLFCVQV
jgi:hypothetical protein